MHHALKAVRGMPRDEGMHVAPLPPFDCRGKRGDEGGEEGDEEEEEEVSWGEGGGGGSAGEGVENGREGRDGGGVIFATSGATSQTLGQKKTAQTLALP